jgi:hypothetical protein
MVFCVLKINAIDSLKRRYCERQPDFPANEILELVSEASFKECE